MTKHISTHATAAKLIRQEIKKEFPHISARVVSSSYAGGNSVNVYTIDLEPQVAKKIKNIVNKYQSGNFDAMTDSYEYTNKNNLPHVKYAFFKNEISDELYKIIELYLKHTFAEGDAIFRDIRSAIWGEFTNQDSEIWGIK